MESVAAITIKDVADLLFAARGRIDFYWNFYVIVVVAVIGWLVSLKKTLTLRMKVLVSMAYLSASAMNFVGLSGAYTLAEALRTDLLRMAANAPIMETRLVLEQHSFVAHRWGALLVHVAIGIPILLTIWFARFSEFES
jgi:hypothetical protein